jgi:hypothetical protein
MSFTSTSGQPCLISSSYRPCRCSPIGQTVRRRLHTVGTSLAASLTLLSCAQSTGHLAFMVVFLPPPLHLHPALLAYARGVAHRYGLQLLCSLRL